MSDRLLTEEEIEMAIGYMSQPHGHISVLRAIAKAQNAKNKDKDFQAGRKNVIEELKAKSRDVVVKIHHEFKPGMVLDGTLSWYGMPLEVWQQLLKELEK